MKKITLILFAFLFSHYAFSDVKLPKVLTDGMILQQNTKVKIWGWADPGEAVTIFPQWSGKAYNSTADADGRWQLKISTLKAGGPHSIKIRGKNEIILKDILFGEVWLCSGQSNMEFTIEMLGGWESEIFKTTKESIEKNEFPQMRLFNIENKTSREPLDDCTGSWKPATLESSGQFSAVALFFGIELSKKLGVPVGLITSEWGGTVAQAWTPFSSLEKNKALGKYLNMAGKGNFNQNHPAALYNAMIHPIINYPIKGAIWYQGESNRNDADTYDELMKEMIKSWRAAWSNHNLPFYYVQIAPFNYEEPMAGALLREAQVKTLSVHNTGMAVIMDIGNVDDIHPKNKEDVGKRLAFWALAKDYGFEDIAYMGPLYQSFEIKKKKILVRFDHAKGGLVFEGETIPGFEIAGEDRTFYPALTKIKKSSIEVWSEKVPKPLAVRYAFTNTGESFVYNKDGLPLSSFRTDNWNIVNTQVNIIPELNPETKTYEVLLKCNDEAAQIHYTLDGEMPDSSALIFQEKIKVEGSVTVKARVFKNGIASEAVNEKEINLHKAVWKPLTYKDQFHEKYPGNGEQTLVDGLKGSKNIRNGSWQGFEGDDFEVVLDMEKLSAVNEIAVNFLQDQASWIFLPRHVEFHLSKNGQKYEWARQVNHNVSTSKEGLIVHTFKLFPGESARYIKIKGESIKSCPFWHPGAGQKAWLFVDEIVVE